MDKKSKELSFRLSQKPNINLEQKLEKIIENMIKVSFIIYLI